MSDNSKPIVDQGELVLYTSEDGNATFFLRAQGGTVWLTQMELAELFQSTKQNISLHVKNVLSEGELDVNSVVKEDLTTAADGKRYRTKLFNLDMILAVGYRVKSPRGTQFRQWATTHLREYLVKGFVMDDVRMKDPVGWDYFDELLERIRDIRASEKRFYQKVRDLFALSVDYKANAGMVGPFFAEVQNKMLYAVTRQTAAELIVNRADPSQPNMALTAWKAKRICKTDVIVAKNYLNAEEIDHLNRMVTAFLEFAELRIRQRKQLTMADWRLYVDNFIQFNESPLLKGAGRMSHDAMLKVAYERYEQFDGQRRKTEAIEADSTDLKELEQVEKQLSKKGGRDAS
ncbi:virulence RhuM family protein [Janthinobacterium sp. LB3P112]|uniref:virulence RhuM family protein n=1 Tax=Janthinobacterium sp. LB3P112 TaxID=3424196 RepID=UPI003F1F706B